MRPPPPTVPRCCHPGCRKDGTYGTAVGTPAAQFWCKAHVPKAIVMPAPAVKPAKDPGRLF
jgi:hypothetical protein